MQARRFLIPFALALLTLLAGGVLVAVFVVPKKSAPSAPSPAVSTNSPPELPSSAPRSWPTPFSVKVRDLPPPHELPPGTLRVLVIGDSVAKFLGLAMRYRQDELQSFVAERGVGSCNIFASTPFLDRGKPAMTSSCSTDWASDVAELRPDITLIVMGGAFFNEKSCERAFQAKYQRRIAELLGAMGENAGQVVITRVPYPMGDWRYGKVAAQVDCLNRMLVETAQKQKLPVLDLMSYLCPTPECMAESQGKPIRPDGLHFDGGGTEETARWVLRELGRIAKEARK